MDQPSGISHGDTRAAVRLQRACSCGSREEGWAGELRVGRKLAWRAPSLEGCRQGGHS